MSNILSQNSRIREPESCLTVANTSVDKIQVQDLYEGAYLLCRGFQLKDLTVIGSNGRPIVTFIIVGDDVRTSAEEYRSGRATANVALLKFTIEKLKDQMFEKIRERENRTRKGRNTHHESRGYQKTH